MDHFDKLLRLDEGNGAENMRFHALTSKNRILGKINLD